MTEAPLAGLTVLDMTRVLAGPYCTMLAADMGARVIKIEHPVHGDDTRAWGPRFSRTRARYFLSVNRNKESLALDFKSSDGRRILGRLIDGADVLVENFRPGTLDALGLGYAALSAHPRLIYVSISGFGQTGPRRDEAGYDAVIQGERVMSVTGLPEGPPAARRRGGRSRRRNVRVSRNAARVDRTRDHGPRTVGGRRAPRQRGALLDLSGEPLLCDR
jgi:CoA:oxalate CoA-transferase